MKKYLVVIAVIAVLVVALGTAGFVYAQSSTPLSGVWGMGGGRGFCGSGNGDVSGTAVPGQTGVIHDGVVSYFAEKLGIAVDEINSRLANGETMAQIALSTGLSYEEFRTLMVDARTAAINQAVADGTLTQEQADWMLSRGGMMGRGMTDGSYGRGMMGRGRGQFQYNQTNP